MKNAYKKFMLIILLLIIPFGVFAAGSGDDQSQALLYKQKRTTWEGAPESAIFYECYLVKYDDNVLLLDTYLTSSMLIINTENSMKIIVHNQKSMLTKDKTIYKCVVLESGGLMGIAIVNVFTADIINIKIGYTSWSFYYDFDFSEDRFDRLKERTSELIVFFPNDNYITIINQWPNPTEFKQTDMYSLLYDNYNKYLQKNKNLTPIEREELREDYEYRRSDIIPAFAKALNEELKEGFNFW